MDKRQSKQFEHKTNEELLAEYSISQSLEVKQEIVVRYLYVIKTAAIQMRDVYLGFTQMEDIIHEGVIVLMKAIDKFDIDKNVKFETYISKRIRGMIIDLARKQDWVPRSARKNAKTLQEASEQLTVALGRKPEAQELADHLEIPLEKFQELNAKTNLFSVLSLDMIIDGTGENKQTVSIPSEIANEQPEESYLEQEFKGLLADGVKMLKEKEQMVISLYYVEELNMKQIAQVMEVSEPRISQIHATAVRKLKEYIENELQLGQ